MEKRLLNFMLISLLVMMGYMYVQRMMLPERQAVPPLAQQDAGEDAAEGDEPGEGTAEDAGEEGAAPDEGAGAETGAAPAEADAAQPEVAAMGPKQQTPLALMTLGSADPESPYRMLVHFTNQGAAVRRWELSSPRYRDLDDRSAYIGHLELKEVDQGCVVGVVGPGTPAAQAVEQGTSQVAGLRAGDIITEADGQPIDRPTDLARLLSQRKPGSQIVLSVQRRTAAGDVESLQLQVVSRRRPLQVISPDPHDEYETGTHPPSYRVRWQQLGELELPFGEQELKGIPSLVESHWQVRSIGDAERPGIEFRLDLTGEELAAAGISGGGLSVFKRFWLQPVPKEEIENPDYPGYDLEFEFAVVNHGQEPVSLAYIIDGPTGLPLEGWWYAYKTHPRKWGGAGIRDVVFRAAGGRHEMFTNSEIIKKTKGNTPLSMIASGDQSTLEYAGVDAQYFTSAILAPDAQLQTNAAQYMLADARAHLVGSVDTLRQSRTEVSFELISRKWSVGPGDDAGLSHQFRVFAGPKRRDLLAHYGLQECVVYGWFWFVARAMTMILHAFYVVVRNYGVAIILLTVLVRGLLLPLGRQQAQSAQKMQELAPEMKRIAESYKDDLDKRAQAQRELFRKHNYNPLSGCLLMFFQLPVFVGLYRALSVDIELRQAALIPGIQWCSNLAGPDKLFYWKPYLPEMLAGPTGWLGPYFNILPLFSVALFLVQQKLFTPPPTDEQQEVQQKVMKFMTLFIGVLFFKVPSGLCLYFIASGLWSIGERKLLPKPGTVVKSTNSTAAPAAKSTPPKTAAGKAMQEKLDEMRKLLGMKPTGNGSEHQNPGQRRKARRKK